MARPQRARRARRRVFVIPTAALGGGSFHTGLSTPPTPPMLLRAISVPSLPDGHLPGGHRLSSPSGCVRRQRRRIPLAPGLVVIQGLARSGLLVVPPGTKKSV